MIKRILSLIVIALGSMSSLCALSMDELCKGFLDDVAQNQQITESLELIRQQKGVLTHIFEGNTLLKRLADDLSNVLKEQKNIEGHLERDPNDQKLEELLMVASMQERSLQEAFTELVKLGKGDGVFETSLPALMDTLKMRPSYGPCVVILQDTFPDLFPEQVELEFDHDMDDEEDVEDDPAFVQPSKESLIQAFRFQRILLDLSERRFYKLQDFVYTDKDFMERDLDGKTLLRHIAECWYHESPKTDDQRNGLVRTRHGAYYSSWEHDRMQQRCRDIKNIFLGALTKASNLLPREQYLQCLEDLWDGILDNEKSYELLMNDLGIPLHEAFNRHKELRKETPAGTPHQAHEKVCAYEVADLFYALLEGDVQLSNAFDIIKEKPYLVNACEPGGLSILHMVLLEHSNSWHKREDLALFFDYLLLNGADPHKTCAIQTKERYVPISPNVRIWQSQPQVVSRELPSVAELVVDQSRYAVPELPEGHSYKFYNSTAFSTLISDDTAQFFKDRLAKFTSGETARFDSNEGEWLKEMMPEGALGDEKVGSDTEDDSEQEQEEPTQEEKEALEELLKQEQGSSQKSTWETWKPSLKYFVAGATLSGITYWLATRSWGDPHEALRQERQRVRATRA